eukprot:GFYU01005921.1.p1 GENE.GFYU01005921.1~~GFYU01005921.1.p1  ORF type:complete len:342 (+),score=49.23 GFYU01005921.1:204-1229(+)
MSQTYLDTFSPVGVSLWHHIRADLTEGFTDLVAGTFAGMAGKVVEFPFDTIKVRLQTQTFGREVYKSPMDCALQTYREGGVSSFYRGMASPMVGAAMENAVLFVAYGQIKRIMLERQRNLTTAATVGSQGSGVGTGTEAITSVRATDSQQELSMKQLLIAGGGAGFCVSFVLTPVELIKCRLQVAATAPNAVRYNGPIDCLYRTVRDSGVRGLYRGHFGTMLRETPGNAAWFGMYEAFCKLMTPAGKTKDDISPTTLMLAGACGGIAYWSAFFPADVVKSRQQTMAGDSASFSQVFREIYRQQGVPGLYRGFATTLVRAVPANAVIFGAYEMISRQINNGM